MDFSTTDSIIFDMDGTLWDATESYCEVWNVCSKDIGIDRKITTKELMQFMGYPLEDIFKGLYGDTSNIDLPAYLAKIEKCEQDLMPTLGGKLFEGVNEGIELLSKKYQLFLLSNCGIDGLDNFMNFSHTKPFIKDTVSFGNTGLDKTDNLNLLIKKHSLKSAVYMGDTQRDCDLTHKAGIPFVFAEYGFGNCTNPDISFKSFKEFTSYFLSIK